MGNSTTKPIRVLQIIGIVCGGGVEAVIMNYYRHINRSQVQFDFVIDGYEKSLLDEEIQKLGGKVYHVEPYRRNILRCMRQIYHIVKDGHYDIVHSNMNTLSIFALFPAWLAGAKHRILHNHSTAAQGEGLRSVMKLILRPFAPLFANHYLACSELAGEWMYGKKRMQSGKVKILNNAIDLQEYTFSPPLRKKYRKELGIPEDAFVIGHVGRFVFQKNHDFLIDVFGEVVKENPKALLVLIGDGELRPQIEQKVRDYHLELKVRFLGLRKDVKNLYNIMDIFVLPSWYEGLPVVAVEAQANGLPCIFSDYVTRKSKLIGSTKFLPYEKMRWIKEIEKCSNKNRKMQIEKMTSKGFNIRCEAEKLISFYDDIIHNKRCYERN